MTKLYRIYTEYKNQQGITAILDKSFPAYTMITGLGCWRGIQEDSLIIEIITEDWQAVEFAAMQIKIVNEQQAVLITEQQIEMRLI